MAYKDWQGGEFLDSLSVGKLLFIPSWGDWPKGEKGLCLRLDPGVVFGSGQHPTTRDSLQALLWVYDQDKPQKVLDLGTGTGILSLAAVSLGAEKVVAVDWNPACVRTTLDNVSLNVMESKIEVVEGKAEDFINQPADLVLANLHFAVIQDLIKAPAFYDKGKEGRFPLSSQKLYRKKKITRQIRARNKQDPFHNGLEKDAKKTISRSLN
jgi:ribosomal protein L11 methyltransferase